MQLPVGSHTILRLRLLPAADRVAQALEFEQHGQVQRIAVSVEGAAADCWPASPPLTEVVSGTPAGRALDRESAIGPTSLLATGAAGTSFWSLAITRAAEAIVFEHACHVQQKPVGFLGSTYELHGAWTMINEFIAVLPTPFGTVQLGMREARDDGATLQLSGGRLVFSAKGTPRTVRWQYQFSFAPGLSI